MRIISVMVLSCMFFMFTGAVQKTAANELAVYQESIQHLNAFLQIGQKDFDLERYKQSKDHYLLIHFAIQWLWNWQMNFDAETPPIQACQGEQCKYGAYMLAGKTVQQELNSVFKVQLDTLANLSPSPIENMPAYYFDGSNYYFNKPAPFTTDVYIDSIDGGKIDNNKAYIHGSIATGWKESKKKVGTFNAVMTKEENPHVLSFTCDYVEP